MRLSILILLTSIWSQAQAVENHKPRLIAETQFVRNFIAQHSEAKRYTYCIENTKTCRDLVFFNDSNSFYNYFTSKERGVCAAEYFISNSDGTFRSYLDETCGDKPVISYADPANRKLRVSFDTKGFPTIFHVLLRKHGTTAYAIADFTFSFKKNVILGTQYDFSKPGYREPLKIVYLPSYPKDWSR